MLVCVSREHLSWLRGQATSETRRIFVILIGYCKEKWGTECVMSPLLFPCSLTATSWLFFKESKSFLHFKIGAQLVLCAHTPLHLWILCHRITVSQLESAPWCFTFLLGSKQWFISRKVHLPFCNIVLKVNDSPLSGWRHVWCWEETAISRTREKMFTHSQWVRLSGMAAFFWFPWRHCSLCRKFPP